MTGIAHKLKLGPHYAIERFGMAVGMLVLALVVFIGAGTAWSMQSAAQANATTTVYTANFSTTGSGVSGSVLGVWSNESRTRAVALVKMADMSRLPIDASKYTVDVYGADSMGYVTPVEGEFACGLYVYGDSGYIAFYITSPTAIPRQRIGVNVNLGLTMNADSSGELSEVNQTDSFMFQVNPGADGVIATGALEGDSFNPVEFFEQVVSASEEASLREALADDMGSLRTTLSYINEYTDRVRSDGVEVTDMTPEWVVGDNISVKDGIVSYTPATVLDGGLEFDWASCSIGGESYIEAAMESVGFTGDADEFMASLEEVKVPPIGNLNWMLTGGGSLDDAADAEGNDGGRYSQAESDTTMLEGAWAAYGATKANYQGDHIQALLELEYEGEKVASTYTSTTTNDGTITVH